MKYSLLSLTKLAAFAALASTSTLLATIHNGDSLEVDLSSTVLVMGRDFGNGVKGTSGSASVTLSSKSELSENLTFGFKSVLVENIFEDGKEDAAYWLSNDKSLSIPEAYLRFKANLPGTDNTEFTVGRKEANYPFFPAYKVRHQAQAIEGVFANTTVNDRLTIDYGHIERYSAWPSRQDGASSLDTSFKKLGERIGHSDIGSGVQFVSTNWTGKSVSLNAYDYYASELYNNAGLKFAYKLPGSNNETSWTAAAHGIDQRGQSNGTLDGHDAQSLELSLNYKLRNLNVNTGWTHISDSASLLVPFRTSYVNDATLLWYTNQFEAGTDSFHIKAVYKMKPWVFASVFVHASHLDRRSEDELDLVVKRKMSEKLSLCVKAGYGKCVFDEEGSHHRTATDLRLFVDYNL